MIETLISLKNNKSKRNATQSPGGAAVERMKKFLSGLSKTRHGMLYLDIDDPDHLIVFFFDSSSP